MIIYVILNEKYSLKPTRSSKYQNCEVRSGVEKRGQELVALLEQEEDFSATMSLLEEVVAARGGKLCWLPKFTPEFQPMECCYRCQNKTFNSK